MPDGAASRLSVVVVTHDSSGPLASALPSLYRQLRPGDELIVVDNASADDSVAVARRVAPSAVLLLRDRNEGFAAGANAGARAANGDLLVFLNPDATPAPGFAQAIRAPLQDTCDWSAWMGLVTSASGELVNTSGGVVHFTGIAWAGEAGAPAPGAVRERREVTFLSGACLAIPRRLWEDRGGFSESFFMYHEDVDLSLRLILGGGRLGVEPAACVDHDYEFDKGRAKWFLLERNRLATTVRCYPGPLLLLLLPALATTELALIAVAARGGWLPEKLAANAQTVRALPRLARERRAIQAARTISSGAFAARLTPDLDSPFLSRWTRARPLRWALRLYWRLVLRALA